MDLSLKLKTERNIWIRLIHISVITDNKLASLFESIIDIVLL